MFADYLPVTQYVLREVRVPLERNYDYLVGTLPTSHTASCKLPTVTFRITLSCVTSFHWWLLDVTKVKALQSWRTQPHSCTQCLLPRLPGNGSRMCHMSILFSFFISLEGHLL